ncbi:MAG: tripartite tricarboxylate transporter substrate-binding protein [Betaproteobacteria bacterium]|jgi:tripartite-type tricarboxylate transporter receptor subunit TctC|nr:tripartite tricarboxylate transporter substrate-binding protein [Betaproteobacteria bacterium]MDH4293829.1 tripartite tricarboxylate transporter substrate-binding protein [Betaproteobacteria bacterium]MDH5342443.1 tripartite tricarboxylate transporter substrate-binding protein [Betaproteobacteria bacterium]
MSSIRNLILAIGATLSLCTIPAAFSAQEYPSRPIRLVVPNAAGSSVDTLGRIFANGLTASAGQQVVVDNRAGAGGLIGMEIGKDAAPDGYTLVSASTAAMVIGPHIHKKLPFDPLKDYEFISLFGTTPNILVVNPSLPVKTVKDLLDYNSGKAGKVNMASAGVGSQSHLAGVLFMKLSKTQSLHVPYKGGGASVAATVAGESQWTITPAPAVAGMIKSGKLRAIGHSLTKKSPLLGDLPSIADTVKGYEYSGWNGLLAPRGTPKAVLVKVRELLIKTTQNADFKTGFERQMTEITTSTPEEFRKFVAAEIKAMGPVVKEAGLTAN